MVRFRVPVMWWQPSAYYDEWTVGSTSTITAHTRFYTLVDDLFIPFHARIFFTIKGICGNCYVNYCGCYRLIASTFLVQLHFEHIAYLDSSYRFCISFTESPALESWEAKGTCIVARIIASRSRHSKRPYDSVCPISAMNQSAKFIFATSCREQEDSGEYRQ